MNVQGTDAWLQSRLGKVTASRLADVIANGKTGEAACRADYRAALVAERLTGKQAESFSNSSMKWGVEAEPMARAAYEARMGYFVAETGMVDHPTVAMTGASPDGLVGEAGLIEAKCPETKNHIATILSGKAPEKYIPQMQWQMACTGRQWCDFISFDPRMPPDLQLFTVRVMRDDVLIAVYEFKVIQFLAEVADTVVRLEKWKETYAVVEDDAAALARTQETPAIVSSADPTEILQPGAIRGTYQRVWSAPAVVTPAAIKPSTRDLLNAQLDRLGDQDLQRVLSFVQSRWPEAVAA